MSTERLNVLRWLALALVIGVIDQVTKGVAAAYLSYGVPRAVVPGLNLTLLHNTGAAFSLLNHAAGWQRWFFSAIAILVGAVVIVWLSRMGQGRRWGPCALALILGGAVGNLVDRLNWGYVVDFIQVYYQQWSWPAFNVADSAITIGAVMLILRGPGYVATPKSVPRDGAPS